jgi:hypothetical protein
VADNGYLHIVGEVQNNTGDHIRFVKIIANFFNSNGQLVDTDYTYIYLDNLPAGDKTCFDISLPEPSNWSYYEFEVPTYSTNGEPLPNFTVLNDSGSYEATDGSYKVIGQVRNDHGLRVENADTVITLYDGDGTTVGCGLTSVNNTRLNPDETSSFERRFFDRDYSDVASHRIQVDGNVQSSPPIDPPDILSNHSYYVDSINALWIVGEIQNNTANYFRLVKITVNIFDNNGQLLDVSYGFIHLGDLPPASKTCFDILVGDEPTGWSYYEFETPSFFIDGEPLPNLTIFNDNGTYDVGAYEIVGQVRNDHGSRVEYIEIVGTIYDDSNIAIGCNSTYVNSTHLDPGQESSFKLRFTGRDYIDVASYILQANGNSQ